MSKLMKIFILALGACFIFLFLFNQVSKPTHVYELKHLKEQQLATQIRVKLAKELSETYQMRISGYSAAMPEGVIDMLGLSFDVLRVLKKEEIREILVGSVEAFLREVNSSEEIRPYLKVYPFTSKNISIGITMSTQERGEVYDPDIISAFASNGILWYGTRDKNREFGYTTEYEETFEEAVELVKQASGSGSK